MRLKFEYRLSGLGWADGFIEVDSQICYFTASYLTDALDDFLKSIISITPSCVPNDELQQHSTFQFYAEPSGTEWLLKRVNDDILSVQITSYSDIDHKIEPVKEMEFEIPIVEFVGCIVKVLDVLIKTHGLVGFRECWCEHDFPLTSFLKLKNYYLTQTNYDVTEYEEKGCQLSKTNINLDIQLLLKGL
jgi:hypothetical protein